MVDTPHSPPGMRRNGGDKDGGDPSRVHEEYHPKTLSSQQMEELHLHTPIIGESSKARALEVAHLSTLAGRTRLENL